MFYVVCVVTPGTCQSVENDLRGEINVSRFFAVTMQLYTQRPA